jgi:hypothetical protein
MNATTPMIALGLRIKTGFAIAVVVERAGTRYAALQRQVVPLSTAEVPESQQPYHPALELPEKRGQVVTERAVAAVRAVARREMDDLLKTLPSLQGAALVVGSVVAPDTIANPHIRAHALEGKLFREVVAEALERRGTRAALLLERDAYDKAAADLACAATSLRREVDALGKGTVTPWRAEEKLAALAAYWTLRSKRH